MDPAGTTADFGKLVQLGAVGVVALALLVLVIGMFKQFVNHALEQNKKLMEQHANLNLDTLKALHGIQQGITETRRDVAQLDDQISRITEGSRTHRPTRPRGVPSGG